MSNTALTREVITSTWLRKDGRTPAGGVSYIEPGNERVATVYNHKVRVFSDRVHHFGDVPTPYQFSKENELP